MAPIRDSVSHSPNQTGLEHPGLDSQYEPSPWSSGSPCSSDGNSNWGKVLVDGSSDKSNNTCSPSSSVWPPSSSSFSCSSSSSGCGSGSDPELASECMDADSSSSVGSEKNLGLAVTTVMMMSANASSSVSSTASSPSSLTSNIMVGVGVNGDSNSNLCQVGGVGPLSNANEENITGSSHYSMAGSSSIGSNNMSNHSNKLVGGVVWGSQSGSNINTIAGSNSFLNGGSDPNILNPNANHGAWPQNPTPNPVCQGQRPSQAQGMTSKLGVVPQQGPLMGWGGMAAPDSGSMMEDAEVNNGTSSSKVLGGSSSGNGSLQPSNLNTEPNGPNNTIMMMNTTTTTNATMTSSPPDSTASPLLSGDRPWGSVGGGNGGPPANGNPALAPQNPQGEPGGTGAFGTPWGTATYPVDKGPLNVDTVNPQISSSAAFKSNNNHNNTGAPRWDQGPTNTPNQPQSNLPWSIGSNQTPGSTGQAPGSGNQTTMGPPAGIPHPWGSSASSSSSSSSSSTSNSKTSNGEWGSVTTGNNSSDGGVQKGNAANNGWKSLEDDAMGMGGAGVGGGGQGLGGVTGGWGRSGGSEGSCESSGGRSSSDRDLNQPKGGNRRKGNHTASIISALSRADVDPRVLSNTGWGQTPIRQNTAWDVNSPANNQGPKVDERKQSGGGVNWGTATTAAPSQTSGGWGVGPSSSGPDSGGSGWGEQKQSSGWDSKGGGGWDDGSRYKGGNSSSNTWSNNVKEDRSMTWTNTPKPQQGWGSNRGNASEGWGNNGDCTRSGVSNHWGEPQKGAGSVGWDSDSDRSGSGCWSEPSRNTASSSNTWVGSGGSNTPDQSTPNPGSSWGDSVHKPNSQSSGWGEPGRNHHGAQNWGDSNTKASNEWGKGPDSSISRGNQGSNKSSGWLGGPMPAVGQKEEASSGWEEPSPESIRRRMEIDDGTAAWGDPGKYSGGAVNMWNRTTQSDQDAMGPASQNKPQSAHNSMQPVQHLNQDKTSASGWGEPYSQQKESSSWGEPSAGPPVTVDNGTSAWGKPMDTSAGWDEPNKDVRESGSGWGNQNKSGPKPMETWGSDVSMGNSWDQEEEVEIGMWSNNQQDNRSMDQNTWNYKQKGPNKMNKPVNKQDDPWMKPIINQLNSMSFSRDSPDDSMKPGAGMGTDKRIDMGSMGDYNGVMGKNPGSRHQYHKDLDRSYFDKLSAYDSPASDELSANQSMSLSPSNSAQPIPCFNSGPSPSHSSSGAALQNVNPMLGGGSVAQGRGGPQSQPPQPNLRNQVPPTILPSQVPPSLLKYPGANGGLNPLLGQHVAVLNQLNQLSQLNHLQRLLLQHQQQQKVQNQRAMPVGRPTEPTRPIGSSPSMMHPPRHLDPSLLKPAPQLKSYHDGYLSQNTPDLQKDTLGSFSNFPFGLNSNQNVTMDMVVGGGSSSDGGAMNHKEASSSKMSRLWAVDPLEQNSKSGAMPSGLRLDNSPFYDFLSPSPSPLSPPVQSLGSVGDGWPPRANSPPPHGNTVTWPPEFRPGEPWKGYPNIDPETDPYVTPGSVINNLSINTVRDTDLLRDRNNGPSSSLNTTMPSNSAWSSIRASSHSGSLTSTAQSTSARPSESKWSPGGGSVSNSSLAHELWKVPLSPKPLPVAAPSRPPPGLTSQKPSPASSGWGGSALRLGGWSSSESRYTPGSSWGDSSSSSSRRTQWLFLKNLTPQIDGSTLRTLCMQHGPLITFHLNLPHGNAVVCYSSKDEAAKAQKSLHMCVLGNTTILAEFASEEEISRFFAQGQSLATPSSSWQPIGSSQSRMDQSHPFSSRASEPNQWKSGDLHRSSLWGGPNYSSSLWGSPSSNEPGRVSSPSPIGSFLPVDHLTGAGDSM
ncbi:trinucleotide repeat-containing gene 6A protein-like isoform X1 [Cyprinodon tularosa]|uniref:trinucleotide repeat-containing gene 6A protein-like isoform X1 n=2 Tax=Cyprinodon tularosa TaxID=77115 RepID=UPI0018E1FB1A|nr:trinucleotide repeat-containing gene 6A protein-like isoform X1 [Cyprinodon tularosa]